ncbi:MAG: hypothetical protein JO339_39430 [Alphaproteobacteria bacterium]|nr:hypothetical protein [Alphaproteobacteria bacterium]
MRSIRRRHPDSIDGPPDRKPGKDGKLVTVPITPPTVRSILWPLHGHDAEYVFTYVAKRTCGGLIRGKRYPLNYALVSKL